MQAVSKAYKIKYFCGSGCNVGNVNIVPRCVHIDSDFGNIAQIFAFLLTNGVCEKFCEIISVRHLTCRNLFLRVGKEFYFGDKIPFFPVNLRGAGNIHSGLYKKASRCVVPNFIKMRIFYEKILPHKIHSRIFYPKMEIFY